LQLRRRVDQQLPVGFTKEPARQELRPEAVAAADLVGVGQLELENAVQGVALR
jgi:hypothetical protein